jgi:hypothetical protein
MIPVLRDRGPATREAIAMSITRRDALAAVVGGGLTTTAAAGADEKPAAVEPLKRDPVYSNLPTAARKVFEDTFPNHRIIRLVTRGDGEEAVYRGTVFDLTDTTLTSGHELVGGEFVTTPKLYYLEVDAKGKVLEELPRPIGPDRVPKAVLAAYEKWNPKGVKRMATMWTTEVPRGKGRVYGVYILVNQTKGYRASFKEDGTVLSADPTDGS